MILINFANRQILVQLKFVRLGYSGSLAAGKAATKPGISLFRLQLPQFQRETNKTFLYFALF